LNFALWVTSDGIADWASKTARDGWSGGSGVANNLLVGYGEDTKPDVMHYRDCLPL
jgi:hypothetical protein